MYIMNDLDKKIQIYFPDTGKNHVPFYSYKQDTQTDIIVIL